jgi:hypothetical protein
MEKWGHRDIETWKHQTENRSPGYFPLIRLLFAHCTNGSLSLVRLLTKKQTVAIRLQTDSTDKKHLPLYAKYYYLLFKTNSYGTGTY